MEPVLIVGAGPVGLSLALVLTQQGIPVEIFEMLPDLNPQDRASTFHPPTLELFEAWGILDTVLAEGQKVTEIQYWKRGTGELVAAFDLSLIKDFTTHPYRLHLPQAELNRILLPLISGQVYFEHRLESLRDHGDHVEAVFRTPDGEKTVRGSYLCGADGVRSLVRRQLDVTFKGKTYADRFLLVDSEARLEEIFPSMGLLCYLFDPQEWVIIQRLKQMTRFTFRMDATEDAEVARTPQFIYKRVDQFMPGLSHNFLHAYVYETHQRVAQTYRVGRVLLLGDAAHVTNPIGGMGLNMGIHDADDLGKKLAAVLGGESDALLDEYSAQRREVALNEVNPMADENYADMAATAHHDMVSRDEKFQELATDLKLASRFLLWGSMLAARVPRA